MILERPAAAPAGGRAAGPCPPSEVQLSATPVVVGGTMAGFYSEVHGLAVDDRFVYATHGFSGIENGHEAPQPGELVIFDREQLRAAVLAGTVSPEHRVRVGRQPRSVASLVRSDYQRVFVVNYHQDSYSVTVLDRRNFVRISEVPIGMTPIDVAVHAGRGRAYVTDGYHGVRVIDARTGSEITAEKIEVGREVLGLAVDEASDTLFVVHNKQYQEPPIDQLVLIDLTTGTITDRVNFPAHSSPRDVAYDATTSTIYVGMTGPVSPSGQIGVVRLNRNALNAPHTTLVTTAGVLGVAVAASAGAPWVYACAQGRLDVLDPATNERVGSELLAKRLGAVAVDRITGEIYAGDLHDGRMFRIATVSAAGPIGQHPLVQNGSLGAALDAPRPGPDGQALIQQFQHGLAVATVDFGAVALRGSHQGTWLTGGPAAVNGGRARQAAAAMLGIPAADTTSVAGRSVTYFADGVIVTTDSGVDVDVSGVIWRRYRDGGEVTGGYGLPLAAEVPSAAGGGYQEFANAVLFHRGGGSTATVVWRGPVWDAFVSRFGGPTGHLGFPADDLARSYQPDTGLPTAEWVQFENGALVWNGTDNMVHRLFAAFWREWQKAGGADGRLGLPTSDPQGSPHDPASLLWFVPFQGGLLVLFPEGHRLRPVDRECQVVTSLEMQITGFKALDWDGVGGGGAADPYIDHWVYARYGGADPHVRWEGRLPGDDDHWNDVTDVPWEPMPLALADLVRGDLVVNVAFHCWDFDTFSDDLLGKVEINYTIDNLWGLDPQEPSEHVAETDDGQFHAYFVMKPKDEPIELSGNFRGRYFWQFKNPDTPRLTPEVYSRTFTDIEAGFQFSIDPRDWLREGWESFFYHTFFKTIAKPGNCYGMSVEAVEALNRRSPFAQPIFQHGHPRLTLDGELFGTPDPANPDDIEMMTRLNIRHGSQLGDRVVQYVATHMMDTLRGGAINDGQRVWHESYAAWQRGDWPVLAMLKEWKKGSHTVLPIRWNELANGEKEIWLADPSKPPLLRDPVDVSDGLERIFILNDGSWLYSRLENGNWDPVGSYNSGTPRWLVWIPMSRFTGQHRSPSVEALLDIVVGGVANWAAGFVVGGDVDTHQISDAAGRTLYKPNLGRAPLTPVDLRSDAGGYIPGLHPVPVFGGEDVPVDGEFHYAVGQHDMLTHDIVPRQPGSSYSWGMRHGAMAAMIVAPTDDRLDRIQAENVGRATRAVSFARGKTLPSKAIEMMVEAFPRMPLPPSRVPADQRTRQFLLEDLSVAGGQRVVAQPSDGGSELLVSSHGAPASFAVRMRGRTGTPLSRFRRVTVEKDRTVVMRPAGWSVESLDSAPMPVEVRESPNGPRVRCYEAVPEGPADQ